jgi:Domain of unknown function (DU1801)
MQAFADPRVKAVFQAWPASVRHKLMAVRQLIFDVAAQTAGVGALEETLKWGEPAYLTSQTRSGSTVRLGYKPRSPGQYALYFHCQTPLVDRFRTMFGQDFRFEGNRAIVFQQADAVPAETLAFCIAMALTYHLEKKA